MRRAQHELVGPLVVEVDEARIGLERVRDLVATAEHLLQVERRVDHLDRVRQQLEMPVGVVPGLSAQSNVVNTTAPRIGTAIVSPKLNRADHHEPATSGRSRRDRRAELALEARPEHVVVDEAADDEQRDQHRLQDQRPTNSCRARRSMKPPFSSVSHRPERIATAIADQPRGRHRRRAPHRRGPGLALELPDRRDSDEDEHDGPAHPDARREDVEDAERRGHAAEATGFPSRRPEGAGR